MLRGIDRIMRLIDVGGQKNRLDLNGRWEIMDIRAGADIIIDLNTCSSFPVEQNSVDAHYISHTLEHLAPERVEKVLKEVYRTLRPGGLVRIVVPDIDVGIDWYLHSPNRLMERNSPTKPETYPDTPLGYLLSWFYTPDRGAMNGHRMAFDFSTLYTYLMRAGFSEIIHKKQDSCSEMFKGKDIPRYKEYSLYVEAVK